MPLPRRRRFVVLATLLPALALVGCTQQTRSTLGQGRMHGSHHGSRACAAPAGLPGRTVRVVLADMRRHTMMGGGARMTLQTSTGTVPAGQVSLVAVNRGWRKHELVVLRLAAGQAAGRRTQDAGGRVDEAGSLGEASASCAAGADDGIAAGSTGHHAAAGTRPVRAGVQPAPPLRRRDARAARGPLRPAQLPQPELYTSRPNRCSRARAA